MGFKFEYTKYLSAGTLQYLTWKIDGKIEYKDIIELIEKISEANVMTNLRKKAKNKLLDLKKVDKTVLDECLSIFDLLREKRNSLSNIDNTFFTLLPKDIKDYTEKFLSATLKNTITLGENFDYKFILGWNYSRQVDVLTTNGFHRFVLYTLCDLFGFKCGTIKESCRRYMGCNERIGSKSILVYTGSQVKCKITNKMYPEIQVKNRNNLSEFCGCDNKPKNFGKYHFDNNYDDTISYSLVPWTMKKGVRIDLG